MISKETLFAVSLFPYLGFLWFLSRSSQTPKLAFAGFSLLLVFVVVTIPAGIYAQTMYGTELANVDWLHGGAEVFLTLSNIVLVVGLERAVRSKLESKLQPTDSSINFATNPSATSTNFLSSEPTLIDTTNTLSQTDATNHQESSDQG